MLNLQKYALLGFPVKHSFSPQMHLAGFNASHIKASYELIEVTTNKLAQKFQQLRQTHKGWNITVPHKEASYSLVDEHDESAKITGCVNTVLNQNGILKGYSTDGFGMERSLLESFNVVIKNTSFIFIGAGGATQATALYFASQGAKKIDIINRSFDKAQTIAKKIQMLNCQSQAYNLSDNLTQILLNCQVIIQGTSLGLKDTDHMPITQEMVPHHKIIVDMIYKNTTFLKIAKKNNCQVTNGLGMLLYQGIKSWEIWTKQKAPIEVMRLSLEQSNG